MNKITALSMLAVLLLSSCVAAENGIGGSVEPEQGHLFNNAPVRSGDVVVHGGHVFGDFGTVVDVNRQFTKIEIYNGVDYFWLELFAEDDESVMVRMDMNRALNDALFAPGNSTESNAYLPAAEDGPHTTALACSGTVPSVWDYDRQADNVVVEVSEGPLGTTMVSFDLQFISYDQQETDGVSGYFLMERD